MLAVYDSLLKDESNKLNQKTIEEGYNNTII